MAQLAISGLTALGVSVGPLGAAAVQVGVAGAAALAQRALTPDQVVKREGSRLTSSQIMSSTEGAPIPQVWSRFRVGGQLIWATQFLETVTTDVQSSGGKFLGPRTVSESTQYTYSTSFAVGLCESDGEVSLGRVWADGKPLDMSGLTYRFYDGGPDQLPDPKIEAVEGIGTVPAFRGLAYLVFENFELANYGNRIPQITVEVQRTALSSGPERMESALQAVNIIPGSGEFVYGTQNYTSGDGEGGSSAENVSADTGQPYFLASLDQLEALAPNVSSASLVVSWFGDSLDATSCTVRPKVDEGTKTVGPSPWGVSGLTRATAQLVSDYEGRAAFGGTPSDQTVREAVAEMKARGLRVLFYPFLLMDTTDYPWRGEITGDPANFLGAADPGDFARDADGVVTYSGPQEWTHRRMILHYAALLGDLLTAADAFLVGTEMEGLSTSQAAWGTGLASLMADARTMLGGGVLVSYAANWSEYDAVNLAPVWSAADFIGIDWYMPLTDWRDKSDEVYNLDTFVSGVAGGEYWDYYYASEADRIAGTQTPIAADGDRQKNIGFWRDANHAGKPIWLTEFGCPAVDKGANQPNIFPDAKSTAPQLPYFSDGSRNDTVQRLYVEAMLQYFADNPGIVDPANMFAWAWDARPYPDYPGSAGDWGDSESWLTGHWLTGRLGGASVSEVVTDLCERMGIAADKIDVTRLSGITTRVRGFATTDVVAPSGLLENLMDTYLFDVFEDEGRLIFVVRSDADVVEIIPDDLIDKDDQTVVKTRAIDTDLPDRYSVEFVDDLRAYTVASVDGYSPTGGSKRVSAFTSLSVLGANYARSLADQLLHEQWIARDAIKFGLPFSSSQTGAVYFDVVKPGSVFVYDGRRYRVKRVTYSDMLDVEAVGYQSSAYGAVDDNISDGPRAGGALVVGSPLVWLPELPLASQDMGSEWSPRVIVRQSPWPGSVLIYEADGSGGHDLNSVQSVQAVIGETVTDRVGSIPVCKCRAKW